MIKPIQSSSLRDLFIQDFEKLIFSGYFKIGEKLPPERELAQKMGVSRPVVHEGLVDLVSKGLVTMVPRKGSVINDYRKQGSLFVLTTLFEYGEGQVSEKLLNSVLDMRLLFEVENASLAAQKRNQDHLSQFEALLDREKKMNPKEKQRVAQLDFEFHHLLAMASDNLIYPLLLNSMKQFYISISVKFFSDHSLVPEVFGFHTRLVRAIADQNEDKAKTIMKDMLSHGESHLRKFIDQSKAGAHESN
ncbi:MAG: FadR family transcriptional regulator [Desulfobacter sp.]|nr:FadR family transcriptional regulator [Desulfobacter sp.]WDP84562.1 MAG: FadR family transcriptional regulator [Desulfobacter sp.]